MILFVWAIPLLIIIMTIIVCAGCGGNTNEDEYTETIFVDQQQQPMQQNLKIKTKITKTLEPDVNSSAIKKQTIHKQQQTTMKFKKLAKSNRLAMIPATLFALNPTYPNRLDSRNVQDNQRSSMTLLGRKQNPSSYMIYSKQQPQESSLIQEQTSSTIVKSSGSGYYNILMKQIKVKSVSQYEKMSISRKLFQVGRFTFNDVTVSVVTKNIRELHANRASVCRLKRDPNAYQRLFPLRIVHKDGSTVLIRHQVPRELIKLPLKLEDCQTEREKMEWRSRRKQKEVIKIKKDDTDIEFDRSQYLRMAIKSDKSRSR
ncbi:mitochondrial ribosomal protein L55 [Dermatophagoides farinae]|uniref:mitochondrial ribosomal protein L55 n=1 Tax=Dermatophagoides farinae TaxID=6954 RepID=UPI003F61D450